jgi:hypothetical protein
MGGRGGSKGGGAGGGGWVPYDKDLMPLPPSPGLTVRPQEQLPPSRPLTATTIRAAVEQFSQGVSIGKFNTPSGLQDVSLRLNSLGGGREIQFFQMTAWSADGQQAGYIKFHIKGDRVQNSLARVYLERQGLGGHIYERIVAFSRAAGARQYVSDNILSYKAAGQWAKMVAKYGGRKNDANFDGHYNHGKQGKPVFEVDLK